MKKYIDLDNLRNVKYHPLPYVHIVPIDADVYSYERGWNDAIDAVIENAPTADVVEVRHGHWEYIGGYGYQYRCSKCFMCHERRTSYCPHCGAKMDGVEK